MDTIDLGYIAPSVAGRTIRVGPKVEAHIEQMVATGLYGSTFAEVAEKLILDGLVQSFRYGILKIKQKKA